MRSTFLLALLSTSLLAASAFAAEDEHRVLGQLNVNQASRDELLAIPGVDPIAADQLVEARSHAPLSALDAFHLPDEALRRLSVKGPSTIRRIRQLPLQVVSSSAPAVASK